MTREEVERKPMAPAVAVQVIKSVDHVVVEIGKNLVEVYKATLDVLKESIKAAKSSPVVAYMALSLYTDLLHGGAYTGKVDSLPYYNRKLPQPDIEIPSQFRIGEFDLLPATPEQEEALLNSDQPHILPKLVSDQAFFAQKEYVAKAFAVNAVNTLVSTISEVAEPFVNVRMAAVEAASELVAAEVPKKK